MYFYEEVDRDHGRLETRRSWITEELHAVRGHWGGGGNRLHWRLEVVFRENASRIRKGNALAIMTAIGHLCMNLFQREPSSLPLAQKRRQAAWDDDYRAKVMFG